MTEKSRRRRRRAPNRSRRLLVDREIEKEYERRNRADRARDVLVEIKPAPIADQRGIGLARLMDRLRQKRNRNPVHDQTRRSAHSARSRAPRPRRWCRREEHRSNDDDDFQSRAAERDARLARPSALSKTPHQQKRQRSAERACIASQPRLAKAAKAITAKRAR